MTKVRSIWTAIFLAAMHAICYSKPQPDQSHAPSQREMSRADSLNKLAYDRYLVEPQKALELAYDARALSKEIDYAKGEAQACRQIGLVFWAQANYSLALNHFMEAQKIAETSGDLQTIADITGNIGLVYFGFGDYEHAQNHQEKSLAMQRQLKNKTREAAALNNLGDIKRASRDYDSAIVFYSEALRLREEENNRVGQSTNIRNIGNVYEDQGKFDLARVRYFISMKICDEEKEKKGMSLCRYSIASVYFKMNRLALAKQYAIESLDIAKQANYRASIRDAYYLLSQITESEHRIAESFRFFKFYSAYRDSVLNLKVASEIASQRLEYETEKKQNEIDLLKKHALVSDMEINKKNSMLFFIAITVVLLMIVIGVLLGNYSRQKGINKILKAKNEEIEKQRAEIMAQRDRLILLNEEITAHQEAIIANRDELAEKNTSIAEMNQRILEINNSLEKIIVARTSALERQNEQLIEYAFLNAHKLRAPLARIMGLVNLVMLTKAEDEQKQLMAFLTQASQELDDVARSINEAVQEGTAFNQES